MNDINSLINLSHQNALNHGFWNTERNFAEQLALFHSEISEILEDYRNGKSKTEIYYEGEKPCGIPIEIADLLIRVFDTCGAYGIDLEKALEIKMEYNKTRPYKHNKKI